MNRLKRPILIIIGVIVGSLAVFAQSDSITQKSSNRLNIEGRTGMALGTKLWRMQNGRISEKQKAKPGIEGSYFLEASSRKIIGRVGISGGYFNKDIKHSGEGIRNHGTAYTRISYSVTEKGCFYFSIPIQVMLNYKRIKPFAGFAFTHFHTRKDEASSSVYFDGSNPIGHNSGSGSGGGALNHKDIGVQIGARIDFTKRIALEANYYLGTKVNRIPNIDYTYKNTAIGFSLQYRWDMPKSESL